MTTTKSDRARAWDQLGTKAAQEARFDRLHRALANVTKHYAVLKKTDMPKEDDDEREFNRQLTLGQIVILAAGLSADKLSTLWAVAGDLANEGKYLSCPAFSTLLDDDWREGAKPQPNKQQTEARP
jgi:hypothetical protein